LCGKGTGKSSPGAAVTWPVAAGARCFDFAIASLDASAHIKARPSDSFKELRIF
jgi:hypothetical protein